LNNINSPNNINSREISMKTFLRPFLTQSLFLLCSLAATLPAIATEAGWRQIGLPSASGQPAIPVALYYQRKLPPKPSAWGHSR
jgi:hypothetical protein